MDLAQGDNHFVQEWPNIPKEAFLYFPRGTCLLTKRTTSDQGRGIPSSGGSSKDRCNSSPSRRGSCKSSTSSSSSSTRTSSLGTIPFTQVQPSQQTPLHPGLQVRHQKEPEIDQLEQRLASEDFPGATWYPRRVLRGTPLLTQQSGAIYICGRDHCFRPIIVIDIGRFDTNNSDIQKPEFLSKVLGIFFEFMISDMLVEGQVENYVMLLNLNSLNMFTIGGVRWLPFRSRRSCWSLRTTCTGGGCSQPTS